MKLSDALSISMEDASKLSRAELSKFVQAGVTPLNKRIKNLRAYEDFAPAVKGLEKSGGAKFSTRGKNRNELLRELHRIQTFAMKKTSTVRGAKDYEKFVLETAGAVSGSEENKIDRAKAFWRLYRKIEDEMGGEIVQSYGSSQIQSEISVVENFDDIDIMNYIKQVYEKVTVYDDRSEVSDFFTPLE